VKKFVFPLGRVLDWRRAQLQREEIQLERLYAELRAIDASLLMLNQELHSAETGLRARAVVESEELGALHTFQKHAILERGRIAAARAGCRHRIATQMKILLEKRKEMKLLETLEEQRLEIWQQAKERETTQQAEESHQAKRQLARRNRENI
jgi:flagellar export protein FliJ